MKYLYWLLPVLFLNSCSNYSNATYQIIVASKIIQENENELAIPSGGTRPGEKMSIVVDPRPFHAKESLQGFELSFKPSFRDDSIVTKGVFTIYHYRGDKAPKKQRTRFDFTSKSGEIVNIPIQIDHNKREKSFRIETDKGGNKIYRPIEIPPIKATLQLSATRIDLEENQ